jgi:DNA-binding PadR family transcriptional regulator
MGLQYIWKIYTRDMARSSQTDLAVLAVLSVAPMSGYAVREAIRDQLGHFWSESFGQIYPTLASLVSQGLASKDPGERSGSSVFSLTAAGRTRLLELLQAPEATAPPRNGLMLRVFFGRTLGPDAVAALVRQTREQVLGQLAAFDAITRMMQLETDHADHQPYWALTVSAGRHSALGALAWCDEALATLATLPR